MSDDRSYLRARCVWPPALAAMFCVAVSAADVEYQVKGGYLYNFTKFVEWPDGAFSSAADPIVIGILGDDPFGRRFDEALSEERSQGRPIRIRRMRSVDEAAGCHIVYISRSEQHRVPQILASLKGGVLTVGDGDQFAKHGGIIEFVIVGGKVRFAINVAAEKRAGLKLSSELKKLAVEIVRN